MHPDHTWSACPHLSAGTCPALLLAAGELCGGDSPRPTLTQDLALERLAAECASCPWAPAPGERP